MLYLSKCVYKHTSWEEYTEEIISMTTRAAHVCPDIVKCVKKGFWGFPSIQSYKVKFNLFSLLKRRLRGDSIIVYRQLHTETVSDSKGLLNLTKSQQSHVAGIRTKQHQFNLEIKLLLPLAV